MPGPGFIPDPFGAQADAAWRRDIQTQLDGLKLRPQTISGNNLVASTVKTHITGGTPGQYYLIDPLNITIRAGSNRLFRVEVFLFCRIEIVGGRIQAEIVDATPDADGLFTQIIVGGHSVANAGDVCVLNFAGFWHPDEGDRPLVVGVSSSTGAFWTPPDDEPTGVNYMLVQDIGAYGGVAT